MARGSFLEHAKRTGIAALWLVLFASVGIVATIGLSDLVPGVGGRDWGLARNGLYEVVGFLFATWLVGVLLGRESWGRLGWRPARGFARHLVRGIAVGVAMAGVAVVLALLLNGASLRIAAEATSWTTALLPVAVGVVLAALAEELMFRGFPLRRLADAAGPWIATVVLAALFSVVHFDNPDVTVLGKLNIFLAGVWLSVAFLSPGGMGLAWGLHAGWNAGLALLFGVPVSGFALAATTVEYHAGARAWVDGGGFGPEGGVVGTVVFLAGLALLLRARVTRPREWFA